MQTIQVTTYTQCNLIDANMITDLSLSMKVRKIITNLKYNQENARHLKKQMKAYEMETKALPQLGMLSLMNINCICTNVLYRSSNQMV